MLDGLAQKTPLLLRCSSGPTSMCSGVSPIPTSQSISQWFNPAAFTTPAAFTWGTLGRDTLRGPGLYNLDGSISRKFRFGEKREFSFRWELFNSLNHPQFGLPNATVGVGGAATITTTQCANRQMQFCAAAGVLGAAPASIRGPAPVRAGPRTRRSHARLRPCGTAGAAQDQRKL